MITSPSELAGVGRVILEKQPESTGSLGIATSEPRGGRAARGHQVCPRQRTQPHAAASGSDRPGGERTTRGLRWDWPDVLVGCTGGGKFGGFAFRFLAAQVDGKTCIVDVGQAASRMFTRGFYAFDFGDTGPMSPMMKIRTLGTTSCDPHPRGRPVLPRHESAGERADRRRPRRGEEPTAVSMFVACQSFVQSESLLPSPEAGPAVWLADYEYSGETFRERLDAFPEMDLSVTAWSET